MSYLKSNFKDFINQHGHNVLVKHNKYKQTCPLFCEGNPKCPHCFGLDRHYRHSFPITRRGGANSQYGERSDTSEELTHSGNTYDYFFLPEIDVTTNDLILEYKDNNFELFQVLNSDYHRGDGGVIAFQTALSAKVKKDISVIRYAVKLALDNKN